jgi:amino acid adenylation domain-containing protein
MRCPDLRSAALPCFSIVIEHAEDNETVSISQDATLALIVAQDGLSCQMVFAAGHIDEQYAFSLRNQFAAFLEATGTHPDEQLSRLPLVSSVEKTVILEQWNDTYRKFNTDICMHELFEEQVLRQPNAVATIFEGTKLTYAALNERANHIAHLLIKRGIPPGNLVGVCLDRCHDMIAGLLAILKAGCAYVPLEPSMPSERIASIMESAGITAILTQQRYAGMTQYPKVETIFIDQSDNHLLQADEGQNLPRAARPDDLAYVIYTSGSTGRPKGVAVAHRPTINLFEWVYRTCNCSPQDCVLFVTSLRFDLSVLDIFGMLGCGGKIFIVEDHKRRDAAYLARTLCEENITFWDSAPAALQLLIPSLRAQAQQIKNTGFRQVFLSGDWIPVTLPDDLRAIFPCVQVMGLGGATEATVWSNYFPINRVEPCWRSIPYGRPLQNCRYYILDEHYAVCPPGVTGDLYIAGVCLSQGYLNEPELTERSYLLDPFSAQPGERMYRTGDLARYFPDGTIEFLGRSDFQVKVRGYRIELGEIEQILRGHESIKEAVVTVQQDSGGDQKLVAYLISANGSLPPPRELRSYAARFLPDYMVPNIFAHLESFPLSPNGKVDRKQLPWPVRHASEAGSAAASSSRNREGIIELLTNYFKEVLHAPAINLDDDFFDLGVTSLNLIQIAEKLQQGAGITVSVEMFLDNPSIRAVATHILREIPASAQYAVDEKAVTACASAVSTELYASQKTEISLLSAAAAAPCTVAPSQSSTGAVHEILKKIQITLPAEAFADSQVTDGVIARIRQALAVLNNGCVITADSSCIISRESTVEKIPGASTVYPEAMPEPVSSADHVGSLIKLLSSHFTAVLGIAGISPDDDIFDLGVTSLNLIQISERLQQQNNITIPVEVFLDHITLRDIAAHIASSVSAIAPDSGKSDIVPSAQKVACTALSSPSSLAPPDAATVHEVVELNMASFSADAYTSRSCIRTFSTAPIPLRTFSQFLGLLKQELVQGKEKYLYPSAGGLNAVQTYLYIRQNCIEGLEQGMYYYHPVRHALIPIAGSQSLDLNVVHPANRELLDRAGFCIFFIAHLAAIEPVYSTLSTALVTLDAGYMSQLLMGRQQRYAIGLCPVAGVDAQRMRTLLNLDDRHLFVHCLTGGSVQGAELSISSEGQHDALAHYIRRTGDGLTGCYAGTVSERARLEAVAAVQLAALNALTDAEHADLHQRQLHLRSDTQGETTVSLPPVNYLHNEYLLRSTQRSFLQQQIPFKTFSLFMALLKRESVAGQPKYLYPSAGGMYAVQTFVHIKPGAVEQVPEGIYYYHPDLHILSRICARPATDIRSAHLPGNRSYYAEAGFSIFLITRLNTLQPVFGSESLYLSMLESGYIGQVLMERQAEFNIGVCPIGAMRFDLIRPAFRLDESHRLVHSFLCGPVERSIPLAGHECLKIL